MCYYVYYYFFFFSRRPITKRWFIIIFVHARMGVRKKKNYNNNRLASSRVRFDWITSTRSSRSRRWLNSLGTIAWIVLVVSLSGAQIRFFFRRGWILILILSGCSSRRRFLIENSCGGEHYAWTPSSLKTNPGYVPDVQCVREGGEEWPAPYEYISKVSQKRGRLQRGRVWLYVTS